jgi:spore maturation protein CgeB
MKILLAGDFRYFHYEECCAQALEKIGVQVERFEWRKYFSTSLAGRLQTKLRWGPSIWLLNRDLLRAISASAPDVVFIWRGNPILTTTLQTIRRNSGAVLVSYHNDNPFGLLQHRRFWRLFLSNIPQYDVHFVFRSSNLSEFTAAGARAVHLLRAYFIPELHRPLNLAEQDRGRYGCEAVFVGHYENDQRVAHLSALVQAGIQLRLFGGGWKTLKNLGDLPKEFWSVTSVEGLDYVKALNGSIMCLNFLSTLNRDSYTIRCFEIPACGRVLLSQRTDDLRSLFEEDYEAVFFSSPEELVAKALELRADPERAMRIASAGRARCIRDKHDVDSRMAELINILNEQLGVNR